MPVTDGERVNVFDRRIIGAVDFDTRMLAFLETATRRHLKGMLTGATPTAEAGTWLAPVTVTDGAGLNDLTFGQMYGTDGNGEYISVDAADPRLVDVPFEDAAVTYYLATRVAEVPVGIQADTEAGDNAYDYHRKDIGHRAEPTIVIDSGGFITIIIGNHDLGTDDFTGRQAIVFLKTPVDTTAATAIETVSVVGTTVTTVGTLGQSTVSTTASDYEVILMGPTITRSISVATAALWAYIGTVIGGGSPRVFDTSSQPAVVSLNELSSYAGQLLSKGWVTRPTFSITDAGATLNITSTSTVFTNGRILTVPTGASFTGLPVTSDIWLSYSVIAGDIELFTTWDTANSGTNVPVLWAKTDGASLVTVDTVNLIGRLVKEFPETVLLTLSSEETHHGAFQELREVLGYLGSLQDSATIPPRSARIEVVGRVQVTTGATVDDADFYDPINVHFVGVRGRGSSTGGAILEWDVNATSLFQVPAASTMNGWTFEGIKFNHTGTPSAATVVIVRNLGTVSDLTFKACTFGDGTVDLPGAYSSDGATNDLAFIDCLFQVSDVAIRQTVTATDGIQGLLVRDCKIDQTGLTVVGTQRGFIRDDSNGGTVPGMWRVKDNTADLAGEFIRVEDMDRCWLKDNDITIRNVDERAIQIGVSTSADVQKVWVHDNAVAYPGAAAFTLDGAVVVRSNTGTRSTGNLAGVFIHNNFVEGTGYTAGNGTGMNMGGNSHDGSVVGHNAISKFTIGMECGPDANTSGESVLYVGNIVEGGALCYDIAGLVQGVFLGNIGRVQNNSATVMDSNSDGDCVFIGNIADTTGTTTSIAWDVATNVDNSMWIGNHIAGTGTALAVVGPGNAMWVGNHIDGDQSFGAGTTGMLYAANNSIGGGDTITFAATGDDGHVFAGNRIAGDLGVTAGSELGDDTVVVGNRVNGVVFNGTRLAMVGNLIADTTTANEFGSGASMMAVTGNVWRDAPNFNAASGDSALTGNVFENAAAWSLDTNRVGLAGNLIVAALTLAAGSNDICAVGNRLNGGAITDSGTGNTVVSNDI